MRAGAWVCPICGRVQLSMETPDTDSYALFCSCGVNLELEGWVDIITTPTPEELDELEQEVEQLLDEAASLTEANHGR